MGSKEMERLMIDPYGRQISYLRVSVTDRCDLRCAYCMHDDVTFLPKAQVLSLEEIDRLCTIFVEQGIEKIRITGGEPLVRRNVTQLIRSLSRHLGSGALKELTLTTNATQLERHAAELADCGIERINVSLDTLRPETFHRLTRGGDLDQVLRGIEAARQAGLKVKINTVALGGINETDFTPLVNWCGDRGFDLVFIETMPMGGTATSLAIGYLPLTQVKTQLEEAWTLEDSTYKTNGPAHYHLCRETGTRVGFIAPMSQNFCQSCNRVRLTCTGTLYTCLGREDQTDLRTPLRTGDGDAPIQGAITEAIGRKPKGHDFSERVTEARVGVRPMNTTGG